MFLNIYYYNYGSKINNFHLIYDANSSNNRFDRKLKKKIQPSSMNII